MFGLTLDANVLPDDCVQQGVLVNPADESSSAPHHEPPDESLLSRIASGDARAERELFERHAPRVYRLASRIAGLDDIAADVVQEVFVKVFEGLEGFRGEAKFTTWLHRVTVTTSLNAVRSAKRHSNQVPLDATANSRATTSINPLLGMAIEDAIASLDDARRVPLVMHALEGFSHEEIAVTLGLTAGTSRRRVSEARAMLREQLSLDNRSGGPT